MFWFGLFWFYGISIIVGYLMPNPFLWIQTVRFQTIQFSISTQFKCQKHIYFKLFSLVNKDKWSEVLLCIANNPIKLQSFIYTELNFKTVLFQKIQFCVSTRFSSIWSIDRTLSGAKTLRQRDLETMAMKGFSAFLKSPILLEPHHHIV